MEIIEYHKSGRREHWLARIDRGDWSAAHYLHDLLAQGTFFEAAGERSRVLLLTDGDELASFCVYAEKDDIPDTDLGPWVGFVYTFPQYRGRRCMGLLLDHIEGLARAEGVAALYVSTDHVGLYEKYGFTFLSEMTDRRGGLSRVYIRPVAP